MDLKPDLTKIDILEPSLTTGQKLKKALNLNKFKHIWIQQVIDSPLPIYIISIDSRRPNVYFSFSKLKNLHSFVLGKLKKYGKNKVLIKKPKFSLPIPLDYFDRKITSGAIIIRHDIAGEYFSDFSLYEKTKKITKKFGNIEII